MRSLVTGANGFVGRWLVAALREAGGRVTTLDLREPADVVADLATDPLPRARFDAVFHLAAFSNPSASRNLPERVYRANADASARLARSVRSRRFILASSCLVYGNPGRRIDESGAPAPSTPYSASKLCAEALVRAARPDAVILRPFNHTGPGQSDAFVCPRIARATARAEVGRGPKTIRLGPLDPRLDFFDVRDMTRAYLLAARRGRSGETYNVATGRPVSIGTIARTIAARARVKIRIAGRGSDPIVRSGDPAKFARHTGWRARIPLARTLADLLDWERAALSGRAP